MKSSSYLITLIVLLVLTGITAIAAASGSPGVWLLLGLAYVKTLFVLFYFMELRHAHTFWKSIVVISMGVCVLLAGLIASGAVPLQVWANHL